MSGSEHEESKASLLLAWQVRGKQALVIGAGDVALSRVNHLVRAGSHITVIAGENESSIHPEILDLYSKKKIHALLKRNYKASDLEMYRTSRHDIVYDPHFLENLGPSDYETLQHQIQNEEFAIVCCCIDDYELSTKIYYQCKYLRLPVNIADKPELCDFYFGSMYNRDNLQIMVSTNGKSPRLSRMVKDSIAKQFDGTDLNKAVHTLGMIRSRFREKVIVDDDLASIDIRMTWIKSLTDLFGLKEWSELDFGETDEEKKENVDKILSYFPDLPTDNYEEFKLLLKKC
ncbi:Piso0_001977 [Millerozyma farinosa CBS 7064]|uniref:precorrin-2 dehydrogenase n=1 Tax=Pichia sorbitophila (strain ATCC MYA-4447 / BCRC 22081 / CBS 7064 / NBRC 10061 / NRRL Y-12695) TaxID=559304 RepID=G8YBC9_PICSO|nr:Piso0_001977 [Millerozyma farinosa CBS 7064]